MGFNCGIVGLPNVGKSTLFNALTSTASAEAANYPFCTIEPNIEKVAVPDNRLTALAKIAGSKVIIPTQLEFVDIAGIVEGASSGNGLGNKFLSHIRETDAILHIVRCFDNDDVVHVSGAVDPLSDISVIETELLLADLESIEGRLQNLRKKTKTGDKFSKDIFSVASMAYEVLKDGKPAIQTAVSENEKEILRNLQLITTKPIMYVCNVSENDIVSGNQYTRKVEESVSGAPVVFVSAAIEAEIALLSCEEEKKEFMAAIGISSTGLGKIIQSGFNLLGLITFFTIGPKEARAWTIQKNTKAPSAASTIHTDFERGFICAETISWQDYVECNGEQGAKQAGKLRLEGKEYVVNDGDVMHFRFNV